MERMRSGEECRVVPAAQEDAGARFAVSAAMLVFLFGLAMLFVTTAPS